MRFVRMRGVHIGLLLPLAMAMVSAGVVAAPSASRFHRPPPVGDDYLAWTKRSITMMHAYNLGDFSPFHPDAEWVTEYLAEPGSIYSDLHPRLFAGDRAETEDAVSFPASKRTARIIAWDLGLDKALPGFQVLPNYPSRTRGDFSTALAVNTDKADLLPEYFEKAYQLGGNRLFTINAEFAVALQILHEWVEATPWADRDALGVDEDVLTRVKAANSLSDVRDQDLAYLADILRSELSVWRAGDMTSLNQRAIRVPLRIARVAAAYRTTNEGYNVCNQDGSRNPSLAGERPEDIARPICFSDATDRAVYRWYRATRAYQLAQRPEDFGDSFAAVARLIDTFADIRPAWAGAYTNQALDWSNHAEVVEAQMALDSDVPGEVDISFYRLVERASLLICRKTTP